MGNLVTHLPWLGVALLLGHQRGHGLLHGLTLVDWDRAADRGVHGGAHLLGLVVGVALGHRLTLLARNLGAHFVGDLGALLARFIPALLPRLIPALLLAVGVGGALPLGYGGALP